MIEAEGAAAALDEFAPRSAAEAPPLARVDAVEVEPLPARGDRAFAIRAERAGGRSARCPGRRRDVRRLPARAVRPRRPPATATRSSTAPSAGRASRSCAASRTTGRTRRWPASRCAPTAGASTRTRPTGASTPSRSPARSAARGSRCRSRSAAGSLRGGRDRGGQGPRRLPPGLRRRRRGGGRRACGRASTREDKPFAVMTDDPGALADRVRATSAALLASRARPIVLAAPARSDAPRRAVGRAGHRWLGLMLPYTPLHHLLLRRRRPPARADERQPLRRADRDRRRRGARAAGRHRRRLPAPRPADPPPLRGLRRAARPSRCAARAATRPTPLPLPVAAPRPLVAVGAELKSTFCVARGAEALLSPHLGDLDTELAYRAFRADLELY